MKILVCDDEPGVRRAIKRGLKGHEITEADDAESALVLFDSGYVPDAVISDFTMRPDGMTGYIFLADHVRHRFPKIPYVLVSGDTWVASHAVVAGIPYLGKPFTIAEIRKKLGIL